MKLRDDLAKQYEAIKKRCNEPGHRRPVTRREFLAQGLLKFTAAFTLPTVVDMAFKGNLAMALQDPTCQPVASTLCPFITVNLVGGGSLAANYLVKDAGRQQLKDYGILGQGKGPAPETLEFGNVPFFGKGNSGEDRSQLIVGLRQTASRAALDNSAFVAVCTRSQDDDFVGTKNSVNLTGLLAGVGYSGKVLPATGMRDNFTGCSQLSTLGINPTTLVKVSTGSTLLRSLNPSFGFRTPRTKATMNLIRDLTKLQGNALSPRLNFRETMKRHANCATDINSDLTANPVTNLTVTDNASLTSIYGLTAGMNEQSEDLILGSIVYNCLNGNTGPANLDFGGFDYHSNNRTDGDAADLMAGRRIGQILESARQMGKKVFIQVCTDGSCSADMSASAGAPWTSDRGIAGVTFFLIYDPAGRPATSDYQVGHYTQDASSDDTFVTGGSCEIASLAVLANYLKYNKQLTLLNTVLPVSHPLRETKNLDAVLRVG